MGRLTEIAHFFGPEEAVCARAALEAHGFFTVLTGENHLNVEPHLRFALGGYRLLAPEARAVEALEMLSALQAGATATPGVGQAGRHVNDQIRDQNRGERRANGDVEESNWRRIRKNWLWLPVSVLHGFPFLPVYRSRGVFLMQALVAAAFIGVFVLAQFAG